MMIDKAEGLVRRGREWRRGLRIRLARFGRTESPYRYVFQHIPKCAGTSARNAFTNWFVVVNDFPRNWATGGKTDRFRATRDLGRLRCYHLLVGNFHLPGTYLEDRYPVVLTDPKYRVITFVRDPLELQLSLYHYEKKHHRLPPGATLEQQLLKRPNYISERLPCTEENYREVLDRYFFVGLAEQLQQSFDVLARKIGAPPVNVGTYNRTPRGRVSLSEQLRGEFRDLNALDYLVYAEAKRRADERYGLIV